MPRPYVREGLRPSSTTCAIIPHMHSVPHGHTWREIVTSFALIAFAILIVIVVLQPGVQMKRERDLVREEGVRDLMEGMLEMRYRNPEMFAALMGTVAAGQTMIGTAYECAGDFGPRCGDVILRDSCVNLEEFGSKEYLPTLPVDPSPEFAPRQTGYYLYLENSTLEVGACNPESREEIILNAHLGE